MRPSARPPKSSLAVRFALTITLVSNLVGLGAVVHLTNEVERLEAVRPTTIVIPSVPDFAHYCDRKAPKDFNRLVLEAATEFDLDPWILAVTVYRESDCRERAKGSSGEIGLAQVNPSVWAETLVAEGFIARESDLYDPRTNLRSAAWILAKLRQQVEGDELSLFRRYNGAGKKADRYATEQLAVLYELREGA